jgi:hypothetical protein
LAGAGAAAERAGVLGDQPVEEILAAGTRPRRVLAPRAAWLLGGKWGGGLLGSLGGAGGGGHELDLHLYAVGVTVRKSLPLEPQGRVKPT